MHEIEVLLILFYMPLNNALNKNKKHKYGEQKFAIKCIKLLKCVHYQDSYFQNAFSFLLNK